MRVLASGSKNSLYSETKLVAGTSNELDEGCDRFHHCQRVLLYLLGDSGPVWFFFSTCGRSQYLKVTFDFSGQKCTLSVLTEEKFLDFLDFQRGDPYSEKRSKTKSRYPDLL